MNFVLDSSYTLAFIFRDEATQESDQVLDTLGQGAQAFVPALWRWEVGNALLMALRAKRLTAPELNRHLTLLSALPIVLDQDATEQAWGSAQLLARKHKLTLYDAAYLELASRLGLPLASLDKELRRAAQGESLRLMPTGKK